MLRLTVRPVIIYAAFVCKPETGLRVPQHLKAAVKSMHTHLPAIVYASRYRKVHLLPAFSSCRAAGKVLSEPLRGRLNPVPPVEQVIGRTTSRGLTFGNKDPLWKRLS